MGLGDLSSDEEQKGEDEEEVIDVESQVTETTEIAEKDDAVEENSLLKPVSDISDVVDVYSQFEEIKSDLLDNGDTTQIGSNVHVNKSGWRKIATAFNVSVEVVEKDTYIEDGVLKSEVVAIASAPNGKRAQSVGHAGSNETNFMEKVADDGAGPEKAYEIAENKFGAEKEDVMFVEGYWRWLKPPRQVKEHNVLTLASTRAKNRAISDCVGGGEVSAEEITADDVL